MLKNDLKTILKCPKNDTNDLNEQSDINDQKMTKND